MKTRKKVTITVCALMSFLYIALLISSNNPKYILNDISSNWIIITICFVQIVLLNMLVICLMYSIFSLKDKRYFFSLLCLSPVILAIFQIAILI